MHKSLFIYGLFLLNLSACATASVDPLKQLDAHPETLYGVTLRDTAIELKVISTGCTNASDFTIRSRITSQQCEVSIYRIKPDRCKRAPYIKKLALPWNKTRECQHRNIRILNPTHLESISHSS